MGDGSKRSSFSYIEIYTQVAGRVGNIDRSPENELYSTIKGDTKSNLRKVILVPKQPLPKMISGDYLTIPWGVKPNIWVPPNAPNRTGPAIILSTPGGNSLLKWDGTAFCNSDLKLSEETGSWCLTGEIEHCFSGDFLCEAFPDGYSYVRPTGPLANFRIINFNPELDHVGRLSHYSCLVEFEEQPQSYMQE